MPTHLHRRAFGTSSAAGIASLLLPHSTRAQQPPAGNRLQRDLRIKRLTVTPIALPDPPILAASGCHGPYFLRNIIEIETDDGVVGIGETHGGEHVTRQLNECRKLLLGKSVFAYRGFVEPLSRFRTSVYAAVEVACLDAIGHAVGRRVCELLGGPVRDEVEFAAYLFYRYAADHPRVLDDPRLVDDRGKGDRALDDWGEVRTPQAMAEMAWRFHKRWGFRAMKLKAGVLIPKLELETMQLMNERFAGKHPLRIDPNARWTVGTAVSIGRQLKKLPLEYYEDPVRGQSAMADVRTETGLPMSTNSCVTRFTHLGPAARIKPIDIVLGDHHYWGGITGFQALGHAANGLGWGLSMHSNNHAGITMAAMIHAGAATPHLTYASDTHYVWLVDRFDIINDGKLRIQNGTMKIPNGRGLGVTLNRDRLAKAHEVYKKCGMRSRDDATTMRRFEPGWKRNLF